MNSQKRNAMIRDLISKYPKGPRGTFKKKDYYMRDVWSNAHGKYRQTAVLKSSIHGVENQDRHWGGYPSHAVYALEKENLRRLVREAYSQPLTDITLSRRTNILRDRLNRCTDHVRTIGIKGVYRVNWGWRANRELYMYGNSVNEVRDTAVVFNGTFGFDMNEVPNVRFFDLGGPEKVTELNRTESEEHVSRAKNRVEELKKRLEEEQQRLRDVKDQVEVIDSIIGLQEEIANV